MLPTTLGPVKLIALASALINHFQCVSCSKGGNYLFFIFNLPSAWHMAGAQKYLIELINKENSEWKCSQNHVNYLTAQIFLDSL